MDTGTPAPDGTSTSMAEGADWRLIAGCLIAGCAVGVALGLQLAKLLAPLPADPTPVETPPEPQAPVAVEEGSQPETVAAGEADDASGPNAD